MATSPEITHGLAEVGGRLSEFAASERHARLEGVDPAGTEAAGASHARGYEWLSVPSGELRLILGGHDITMSAGEVAAFDTQVPHWFGAAGDRPVEISSLLGKHGERAHVRAVPRRRNGDR